MDYEAFKLKDRLTDNLIDLTRLIIELHEDNEASTYASAQILAKLTKMFEVIK